MRWAAKWIGVGLFGLLAAIACTPRDLPKAPVVDKSGLIEAGPDFESRLHSALRDAKPGAVIRLPAGTFELSEGLTLSVDGVRLAGAGQDDTVLDFSASTTDSDGLLVTSDRVILQDFTIREAKKNGIRGEGADQFICRYITVKWAGEPDDRNGAFAIQAQNSKDVLIEHVTVSGASKAGIHAGLSENVIVRNSVTEYNPAGVALENVARADIYGNVVRNNAGGILVFDLPDLGPARGHSTRVFENELISNNYRNFAAPGSFVSTVPSGTGLVVFAGKGVQITSNDFQDSRSTQILLLAYGNAFQDALYSPLPEDIVIRGNRYIGGGHDPQGILGALARDVEGKLPEIVSDGVDRWPGQAARPVNILIEEPPTVGFLSFGLETYSRAPARIRLSSTRPSGRKVAPLEPLALAHDVPS